MSIHLEILVDDKATPVLNTLLLSLTDPTDFHRVLALDLSEAVRRHVREAAKTRHKTADRLGAPRSGYLARAAETVEASGDKEGVELKIAGAIFKRVNGPVVVRPLKKQYLTIPIHREAVQHRASEISGLFVVRSKKNNVLLCKRGPTKGSVVPYFLLRRLVILPEDKELLPSPEQLGRVAERAAAWYFDKRMREERV